MPGLDGSLTLLPHSIPSYSTILKKAFTENIFPQTSTLQHPYPHCSTRLLPHKILLSRIEQQSPPYPNTSLYAHEPQALCSPAF